ncbi:MAG: hypothetical protein QXH67_01350 [Candidatus Bathyarchaeia archaeon]
MKKLIGLIGISIFALNLLLTAAALGDDTIRDPYDWYRVVPGILEEDYYELYPFNKTSLDLGFSRYGELIGIPEGLDQTNQANWVGLDYGGVDPFCPLDPSINMNVWINGWYIDIQYMAPSKTGLSTRDRHVWAYAMFSDHQKWGGDWQIFVPIPNSTDVTGGRQTNKIAETEDYKVLYHGPRRFVAELVTHIYDYDEGLDDSWPVADVIITIIFNKVKKEVILLKDVKLTLPEHWIDPTYNIVAVQFSNREEFDLPPNYQSYAHYYEQNGTTCYSYEWHTLTNLTRKVYEIHNITSQGQNQITVWQPPMIEGFIKLWVNKAFREPGTDYTVDWNTGTITFTQGLNVNDKVEVHYLKMYKTSSEWAHKYDIAQFLSFDQRNVAFSAIWPPASDFTVDGYRFNITLNTRPFFWPLNCTEKADMASEPYRSPLLIAEWDIPMSPSGITHFRGVEVKGVTNNHDGDDANMGAGHQNKVDREVKYLLDEVFLPWDLVKAVEKETKRWVEFGSGPSITLTHRPFHWVGNDEWDQYCVFSERVIDLTTGRLLNRYKGEYGITVDSYGYATITGLSSTHRYKVLYSTKPDVSGSITNNITIIWDSILINQSEEKPVVVTDVVVEESDKLGVTYGLNISLTPTINIHLLYNETDWQVNGSICVQKSWLEEDFKVPRKTIYTSEIDDIVELPDTITILNGTTPVANITGFDVNEISKFVENGIDSSVTWPVDGEAVHVLELNWAINRLWYSLKYNTTTDTLEIKVEVEYTLQYRSKLGGRYEWVIVGRDSAAVDSAGAAMISAAFKNKQIEILKSGLDMQDILWGRTVPYVMAWLRDNVGPEDSWVQVRPDPNALQPSRAHYRKSPFGPCSGQSALRDDWCTKIPIASSNIITLGSSWANQLTEYFNEFTQAYLDAGTGESMYPGYIVALTCWSKNTYKPEFEDGEQKVGYAVVATYKDLNGTVGLVIWGWTGPDTFFASEWFHEEGIYQLQEAPTCATSIVLKIDYTEHPPKVSIVEVLGTLSERMWQHNCEIKGGLHSDP